MLDSEPPRSGHEILRELGRELLKDDPALPSDEPRVPKWKRWLQFFSLVVVPAIVGGFGLLLTDLWLRSNAPGGPATADVGVIPGLAFEFVLGAGVGGGLGLAYVIRCIIKDRDP